MRILFVKLGSIGDIVHALPAFALARRAYPDAAIDWVAERRSAEILRGNELIDELIEIDTRSISSSRSPDAFLSELSRQTSFIRNRDYDLAIDLQGLWKSAMVAKLSGAARRIGFDKTNLREPGSRLMLTGTVTVPSGINVIDKNIALVRSALEISDAAHEYSFPIYTEDQHRAEASAIAGAAGESFAILNPAGGWETKLWPAENYGHLADRLFTERGIRSVIAVGPNELELAERAAAASLTSPIIATPSLKGFFELAKRASLYVGGDTGPTHLAVAAGAPVVGIFGPTEWWRNGSPRAADIHVGRDDIGCRVNCHRRTCSNWICMDIEVETVARAAFKRLSLAMAPELEEAAA